MTALAADRKTDERSGKQKVFPLAAAVLIYKGALTAIDASGNLVPADDDTALTVVGVSEDHRDNTLGDAGDLSATVRRGVFQFENSGGGDEITAAHVGRLCYAEDDQTVALTADLAGTARPIAGRIVDVESSGVWVDVSVTAASTGGALAADVGALTDSTGVTPDNTIANVVAASAAAGEATAADLTTTNTALAVLEANDSDLADQINAIRTALRNARIMA